MSQTHEFQFESGAVVRCEGADYLEAHRKAEALAPATKAERIAHSDQYFPELGDDRGPLDQVEIRDDEGNVLDIVTTARSVDRRTIVTAIVTVSAFLAGAGADQLLDALTG
jgi:hypothetical protein